MEVSGRREDQVGISSTEDGEVFCQPCSSDGDVAVAIGYCQNCCEYFCAMCLKLHRKQSISRNHDILEGESMPKSKKQQMVQEACTQPCAKHSSEIVKFFCSSHDTVGCGDCMIYEHKVCKVDLVHDISGRYFNGPEHMELLDMIAKYLTDIEEIKGEIQRTEKTINETQTSALKDMKSLRKKINDYLDKAESGIVAEMNKRKQADEALVSKLKTEEQAMANEVNKLEKGLLLQSNKANELFVTAKQMKGRLISLDARIKETIHKCQWQGYILEVSSDIREMIASNSPIGKLKETVHQKQPVKTVTDMDVHFDGEIDVKTLEDQSNCYIIASTLLSSKLIALADYMNKCVKIVDTQERKISARYELGSAPVDIAVIDTNTFAITLPQQKKIQFLSVKPDYKVVECYAITMNGMCRKIACQRDRVIVAYTEHIEILDTFGYVQKTIAPRDVKQIEGIAFADDSKAFYVSNNSDRRCIRKFDFEGKLLATYEDKYLLEVRGITVTRDGTVLACNWAENASVHVITPDCQKSKEILTGDGHAKRPICVCYCDESGKLYLANNKYNIEPTQRNTLKIFQLC